MGPNSLKVSGYGPLRLASTLAINDRRVFLQRNCHPGAADTGGESSNAVLEVAHWPWSLLTRDGPRLRDIGWFIEL